jgi:hypothetical protein
MYEAIFETGAALTHNRVLEKGQLLLLTALILFSAILNQTAFLFYGAHLKEAN